MFPSAEQAQRFREQAAERAGRTRQPEVRRDREALAEAVAEEFAQYGEGVGLVREPWEHTPAEHAEAQQLVDVAFAQDLSAALKLARQSEHYPRNLDLFHDVLTSELYDLMRETGINRQPLTAWILTGFIVVLVAVLIVILAFVLG